MAGGIGWKSKAASHRALEPTTPEGTCCACRWTLLLVRLGLVPRLGPIADTWSERKQPVVDTATFATSEPGIHAVGDAITHRQAQSLSPAAL